MQFAYEAASCASRFLMDVPVLVQQTSNFDPHCFVTFASMQVNDHLVQYCGQLRIRLAVI